VSIPCRQCGFDTEEGKPCPVCGFKPGLLAAASAKNTVTAAPKRRKRGSLGVLVASGAGLLAVLGIFIINDLQNQNAAEAATQAAAQATAQAAATVSATSAQIEAPAPGSAAALNAVAPIEEGVPLLPAMERGFDITTRTDNPPTASKEAFIAWMLSHTDQTQKFLSQKWDLTQSILRDKSITHQRILEAFLRTPREYFCRDTRRAYENAVLPIGYGSTISGPFMVARMTDYLDPQPNQKVLEVGTGSGYQSAFLSELSNHVYTIEIIAVLARETDAIFRKREVRYPEYRNVYRKIDDGYYGWAAYAPFDRIIVTCGIDHVPPELLRQLAPEGIMVIPVGPPSGQTIMRIVKHVAADGSVSLEREDIFHGKKRTIFLPFTSNAGGVHSSNDEGTAQ
jgi:protein-L-isoaspartate(D-aspartate) O-methyltransferase